MWSTTGRSVGARAFVAVLALCLAACSPAQPVGLDCVLRLDARHERAAIRRADDASGDGSATEPPRNPAAYVEARPSPP